MYKVIEIALTEGARGADEHPDAAVVGGIVGIGFSIIAGVFFLPCVVAGVCAAGLIAKATEK